MSRQSRRIAGLRRVNYRESGRVETDQSSEESDSSNNLSVFSLEIGEVSSLEEGQIPEPDDELDADIEPVVDTEIEQLAEDLNETLEALVPLEMVSGQPAPPPEVFETNPFGANINPTTANGLKLYQAATAERDDADKVSLKVGEAKKFLECMRDDAAKFCWGKLTRITRGTGTAAVTLDILEDFRHLDLDKVRLHMNGVFHQDPQVLATAGTTPSIPTGANPTMFDIDPASDNNHKKIFYNRVRANMIGLRLLASLDKSAIASLKLKSSIYTWKSAAGDTFYDGPTMLQLCVMKVNPSTRVGVTTYKDAIRHAKLASFSHNVLDMTDKMTANYDEIVKRGFTHDDMIIDLFKALLTSKNEVFHRFIQRKKDDWETGTDITPDELISEAVTKYNNMVENKTWKMKEADDSKLVALTTQVKELKEKLNSQSSGKDNNPGSGSGSKRQPIAEWRLKKTQGDKLTKDGTTWYWCPHQHNNGKGMYVTHKPENHTSWYENRKNRGKRDKNGKKSDDKDKDTKPSGEKKLILCDKMKAAMVTRFKCSSDDAEKLWKDVVSQSN